MASGQSTLTLQAYGVRGQARSYKGSVLHHYQMFQLMGPSKQHPVSSLYNAAHIAST